MRVKALRKLLWILNTFLVLGIVAYALFFFILGGVNRDGMTAPEQLIGKRNLPDGAPKIMKDKVLPWPTFTAIHKLVINGDPPVEIIRKESGPAAAIPPLAQNYDLMWAAANNTDPFGSYAHLLRKDTKKLLNIQVGQFVEHVRTGSRREDDWQLISVQTSMRPWRAVFQQDGTEERVTLEQKLEKEVKELTQKEAAGKKELGGVIGGSGKSDKPPREGPEKGLVEIGNNEWQVPPEEKAWWDEYGEDELQTKMAVEPYKVDGKAVGLMVKSVEDKSMLKRRGIRSGDILKSINGKPVKSRQGVLSYLKGEGKGLTTYTVVIERKGREISKTYHVKEKKKKGNKKGNKKGSGD